MEQQQQQQQPQQRQNNESAAVRAKRRKHNPLVKLGILAAVAVVLGASYGALRAANARKAAEEQAAMEAAQAAQVTVASFDPAEMSSLTWESGGRDPLTFVVVNGAWQWKNDPAFPADQSALAAMGNALTNITAARTVGDVEGGLAACGLDDPSCTVTVSYGGDTHTYQCGDYNATTKTYYLMADGTVYMTSVNLGSYFTKDLPDLLARDSIPSSDWVSRDLVTSVTIRDGAREVSMTDADEIDEYLSSFSSVYLRDYADYHADEEEKASYGLDGSRSVTVNYRKSVSTSDESGSSVTNYLDTSYVFFVGDPYEADETRTTVSPASSAVVYLIDAEKADALMGRENGG